MEINRGLVRVQAQIVTFNSEEYIASCLESLNQAKQQGFDLSILIIDNASNDRTLGIVAEKTQSINITVSIIKNKKNTGFSHAHNQALMVGMAEELDFFLILNPDVILEPNCISELVSTFENSKQIGIASPLLYRNLGKSTQLPEPKVYDACGMTLTTEYRHFDRNSGVEAQENDHHFPEYVMGATGACMLVASNCVSQVSFPGKLTTSGSEEFFDSSFFAYREDADVSIRAQQLGYNIAFVPSAIGFHHRRVRNNNRKTLPKLLNRLSVQNRFLLQLNTLPVKTALSIFPALVLRNIMVILGAITIERSSVQGLVKSYQLRNQALAKRRWLFENSKRTWADLSDWMWNPDLKRPIPLITKDVSKNTPQLSKQEFTKRVHIGIISFNQSDDVRRCLEHIATDPIDNLDLKISVLNNSPEDLEFLPLMDEFKAENIVFSDPKRNLGFASGANLLFQESEAEVLLLLNPDVTISQSCISDCMDKLREYSNVGSLSPVVRNDFGSIDFKYGPKRFPRLLGIWFSLFFFDRIFPNSDYISFMGYKTNAILKSTDCIHPVEQLAGACLFVKTKIFNKVDGLSEKYYPAWFEDVDFAHKLINAGFSNVLYTNQSVRHTGGTSTNLLNWHYFLCVYYKNYLIYFNTFESRRWRKIIGCLGILAVWISRFSIGAIKHPMTFYAACQSLKSALIDLSKRKM